MHVCPHCNHLYVHLETCALCVCVSVCVLSRMPLKFHSPAGEAAAGGSHFIRRQHYQKHTHTRTHTHPHTHTDSGILSSVCASVRLGLMNEARLSKHFTKTSHCSIMKLSVCFLMTKHRHTNTQEMSNHKKTPAGSPPIRGLLWTTEP